MCELLLYEKCGLTALPHRLALARSLLEARAGTSRFCWGEERRRRAGRALGPVETTGATRTDPAARLALNRKTERFYIKWREMGLQSCVEGSHLVLDRETAMEWNWKGWVHEENSAGTEAMGREGRGTGTETGGKDPGGPGRARSESRCCIAALGRGPCGHPGRPESEESKRQTGDPTFRRATEG